MASSLPDCIAAKWQRGQMVLTFQKKYQTNPTCQKVEFKYFTTSNAKDKNYDRVRAAHLSVTHDHFTEKHVRKLVRVVDIADSAHVD